MSGDHRDDRGKKPRNYYVDYTKGGIKFGDRRAGRNNKFQGNSRFRETPDITFGHRGFLITSVDEVKCYLEMRNVLEEYYEILYSAKDAGDTEIKKPETTEDELESELKTLRKNRPFKQVKTHCRNTLFINILPDFSHVDPIAIVDRFFLDLAEKRQIKSSNTFKVLPVLDTFRSSVVCAKESLINLLKSKFGDEDDSKKYFIEFQSRGNYKLSPEDKQKMIEGIAEAIGEVKPNWSVDREHSDYIIVLAALKNVCCISILKDYFVRCKYNVIEYCKEFATIVHQNEDHQERDLDKDQADEDLKIDRDEKKTIQDDC